MEPIYITIDMPGTGKHIRELMDERNISIHDIQEACNFERPQAIYKWLSGKSLPNYENMLVICKLFKTTIDGILVVKNNDIEDNSLASSEAVAVMRQMGIQFFDENLYSCEQRKEREDKACLRIRR